MVSYRAGGVSRHGQNLITGKRCFMINILGMRLLMLFIIYDESLSHMISDSDLVLPGNGLKPDFVHRVYDRFNTGCS